jgi:hypothetical protein
MAPLSNVVTGQKKTRNFSELYIAIERPGRIFGKSGYTPDLSAALPLKSVFTPVAMGSAAALKTDPR